MANAPSPNDLTRQQLDELDALLQRMLALPAAKPADPAPKPLPLPDPVPTPTPAVEVPPPAAWRTDRPAGPPAQSPHLTAATAPEPEPAEVLEALAGIPRTNSFAFDPTPAEPVVIAPGAVTPEPTATYPSGPPVAIAPTVPPTPAEPYSPAEPFFTNRLFGPPTPDTGVPPSDATATTYDPVSLKPTREPGETATVPDFGPIEFTDVKPTANGFADTPPDVVASTAEVPSVPVPLWPVFAMNWVMEKALGLFGPPGQALTSSGMKHLLGGAGLLLIAAAGAWTARGMGWIELPWPRP